MTLRMRTDFGADTVGVAPADGNTEGGGTYLNVDAVVRLDPLVGVNQMVKVNDAGGGNGGAITYYFAADTPADAPVWIECEVIRTTAGANICDFGFATDGDSCGGLRFSATGTLKTVEATSKNLYVKADHPTLTVAIWSQNVRYGVRFCVLPAVSKYSIWRRNKTAGGDWQVLGYDASGTWNPLIPMAWGTGAGPLPDHIDSFFSICNVSEVLYFDLISATNDETQDTAPGICTLLTDFPGDDATITSRYNGGASDATPNRLSATVDGPNVVNDDPGYKWISENDVFGVHYVRFYSSTPINIRAMLITGHNFASISDAVSPNPLLAIRLIGEEAAAADIQYLPWATQRSVNLTAYKNRNHILAWIPTGTSCEYWAVAVYALDSLSGVDNIQIGRICLLTDQGWTPTYNFDEDHSISRIDPSVIVGRQTGSIQSVEHSRYSELDLGWSLMPKADYDDLRDLFNLSGKRRPWIVAKEPSTEPDIETYYCRLTSDLQPKFGFTDLTDLRLKFTEIVPDVE